MKQEKISSRLFSDYPIVFALGLMLLCFTPVAFAQSTIDLGTAGNFVILAKSGISTTGTTSIDGDLGVSPIDSTAITGFGLILDPATTQFSTSSLVTGKVYAADYTPPTPTNMTTAISNMETAYTDAAGRTLPDYTELGAGNIGGMTLAAGLYKWSTGVTIPTDVTISGNSTDIWIFQIAGTLGISNGKKVILSGGAKAENIFWQVAGQTTLGTTSVFNGTILDQTAIVLNTGATLNGRALAQTAVTLDASKVSNDKTAPTIMSATTIGFTGANPDTLYSTDQNIRIRVIATDSGSGVASLDVDFYDINGTATWVRATRVDVNTYDINTGHGWTHNFDSITLNIRVNDGAGNSTASTAISNPILLYTMNVPSGLGGATTNFSGINNFSAVHNLTFEKVGLGKIIFMSDVNMADQMVLAQLQSLNSLITFGDGNAGNKILRFDTSGFNGKLAGIDVNGFMYNLPFASKPGLLHEGIRCDNTAFCTTSYAGGVLNFISTIGFSQYDADGNAPILTNATIPGNTTANLGVTINEQATCKYTNDQGKNYNTIIDMNATNATTSAGWSLSGLSSSTVYTYNMWCRDLAGNDSNKAVTFTTSASAPVSSVNLGTAGNFVILAKSGISTTGVTLITGDIGVSPIDSTAITGFGLSMDSSNQFSTSALVTGKVYAADYTPPTPTNMTTAISNMETAYTDAAGRTLPDYTELGAGNIGGMTLAAGLYKWSTGVTIPTDVTISGGANDVWIFQIAGTLGISPGKKVILIGGAQAKNIFWQVTDQTTLGTTAVFNGTILDLKAIVINTGATLNGRALAQTAVTSDASSISDIMADSTAPVVALGTSSVTTSDTTLSVTTNEPATCRYATANVAYGSMANDLNTTWSSSSANWSISGLTASTSYTYYVRCRDRNSNEGTQSISFTTLAAANNGNGTNSSGNPGGGGYFGDGSHNNANTSGNNSTNTTGNSGTITEVIQKEQPKEDLCANLYCADSNPCTQDSCANGSCIHTAVSNKGCYSSGRLGQCDAGVCKLNSTPKPIVSQAVQPKNPATGLVTTASTGIFGIGNEGNIVLGIILAILIIGIMSYLLYFRKNLVIKESRS